MELIANVLASLRNCDWCNERFYQGREDHRFCSRKCGVEFYVAERRAALALYRSLKDEDEEDERARPFIG
jgi:hypothetical protein